MAVVIKIENLYKEYQLGTFGYGTLNQDIQSWWAKVKGKPNPNSIIGQTEINLNKSTGSILALDNINVEINKGERLGIIGKNGAGKTTLLKILSRITSPTSGKISARGRIASLIAVGTGFHKELTGRENIFLNGAILGLTKSEIENKLEKIIDFSGIKKFIDTPVKRYSTGMNIRLGFSVAAHLDPDILIIDEVLAVGDIEFQRKCMGSLSSSTSAKNRTVLFVSHNLSMIKALCEKVIVLQSGKIGYIGNVRDGIAHYLDSNTFKDKHTVDLLNSVERIQKNPPILQSIKLINHLKKNTNQFFQNEKIIIKLKYENKNGLPLTGAGFIIKNAEGVDVGEYNTYMAFPPPHKLPDNASISWTLNEGILNSGTFLLKLFVCVDDKQQIDSIENAIQFTVNPCDIYGTGYSPSPSSGDIMLYPSTIIDEL